MVSVLIWNVHLGSVLPEVRGLPLIRLVPLSGWLETDRPDAVGPRMMLSLASLARNRLIRSLDRSPSPISISSEISLLFNHPVPTGIPEIWDLPALFNRVFDVYRSMGELETEEQKTRAEVASYLRQLADQLDGGDAVTLELGDKRVDLDPVDPITFKLEGESDWTEGDTEAKQSIEFELVWWREAQTAEEGTLTIEQTEP